LKFLAQAKERLIMKKNLGKLNIQQQSGNEPMSNQGKVLDTKLIDFWRWSFSDLAMNKIRGAFAEFIVRTALGLPSNQVRVDWDDYDLEMENGLRIEVKSSSYIQSWEQKDYFRVNFDIKPTKGYDGGKRSDTSKRQADVYVFCLLKHKDQNTLNPLKMEQWEFYVVPTSELDQQLPTQKTISLKRLKTIATPIEYAALKEHILAIKKVGN
jgi:hypothetical protein